MYEINELKGMMEQNYQYISQKNKQYEGGHCLVYKFTKIHLDFLFDLHNSIIFLKIQLLKCLGSFKICKLSWKIAFVEFEVP